MGKRQERESMNKRLQKKKIKEIVASTLKKVNISLEVHQRRTNVNMIYDFIKNEILIDVERIRKARNEMRTPVPIDDYVKAVILHELGHYLDREALWDSIDRTIEIHRQKREVPYFERVKDVTLFQLDIEEHEMDYTFEETAWSNAARLNEQYEVVDNNFFEHVKFESLLSYTAGYNRDLLIYQSLEKEAAKKLLAV